MQLKLFNSKDPVVQVQMLLTRAIPVVQDKQLELEPPLQVKQEWSQSKQFAVPAESGYFPLGQNWLHDPLSSSFPVEHDVQLVESGPMHV